MAIRTSGNTSTRFNHKVVRFVQILLVLAMFAAQLTAVQAAFADTTPQVEVSVDNNPIIDETPAEALDDIGLASRLNPEIWAATLPSGKMKGVSYTDWDPYWYQQSMSDTSIPRIKAAGAGWVGLVVVVHQDNANSTSIFPGYYTQKDESLVYEIRKARSLGMKVMLKPQMWVNTKEFTSAYLIGKGITSDSQWGAWFASYKATIVKYAQIAQANGVEMLSVGTELNGTTSQSARWRDVIAAVRKVYKGFLTFTSICDGQEVTIDWWDAVDFIGVSAYYPLTNQDNPSVEQLKEGWKPWANRLAELSNRTGRPVLFTEIGYRSINGANKAPWDFDVKANINLTEQANCYQAAFESVWNQSWFAGMFWWEWDKKPTSGGANNNGFTPYNKPAETVLRSWYGTPVVAAAAPAATKKADLPVVK